MNNDEKKWLLGLLNANNQLLIDDKEITVVEEQLLEDVKILYLSSIWLLTTMQLMIWTWAEKNDMMNEGMSMLKECKKELLKKIVWWDETINDHKLFQIYINTKLICTVIN